MRYDVGRFRRPMRRGAMEQMVSLISLGDGSTLSLDFTTGVLDPRLTFTRGSTGTRINASGFVETMSNNGPRFDHDPTTLAPRGLLVEGQSVNSVVNSNVMRGTGWLVSNLVTPANAVGVTDPAGGTNATTYTANNTGSSTTYRAGGPTTTTTGASTTAITWSCWVKANGYTKILMAEGNSGRGAVAFDIGVDPPTATPQGGAGSPQGFVTKHSSGWYRIQMRISVASSTGYQWSVIGYPTGATLGAYGAQYLGDNTNGIYVWGAQLEDGSGASSYIPTGASTATRNADSCVMSNIAALNYNANGGTLFAHFSNNTENGNFAGSVAFNNGANYAQRIRWGSGALLGSYFQTNGTSALGSNLSGNRTSFAAAKVATSYSFDGTTTSTAMSINGAQASTTPTSSAVSGVSIATALALNSDNSSAATAYPSIAVRSVKFYPFGMTMAQMNAITVNP